MGNRVFCLEFTLQKHISLADFVVITVYFKPKRQPHGLSFVLRAENETRTRGCASDNLAPSMTPQSSPSLSQLPYYRGAFGVARAGRRDHDMKSESESDDYHVVAETGRFGDIVFRMGDAHVVQSDIPFESQL